MKILTRILILILLLCFYSSSVSASVCCYTPGDFSIGFRNDVCRTGEVLVGNADFSNLDPSDRNPCKIYNEKRLGCVNGNTCSALVNGKRIFDIASIENSLEFGTNYANYCENTKSFDLTCTGGTSNLISGDNTQIINNGGVSGESVDFNSTFNNTYDSQEEREFCSSAGDPFGFFVTKDSCENVDEESSCLFNPYLGGKFSTKFENADILKLDSLENACVPKTSIKECLDYKTKENCDGNLAYNISESSDLKDGCRWIDASQYSENLFEKGTGICISPSISYDSYYDKFEYSFRKNVIKNPSFEQGTINWQDLTQQNIQNSEVPFNGNYYYYLSSGSIITQKINYLAERVSYLPSVFVQTNNFVSDSSLKVSISAFDENNHEISDSQYISSIDISQIFTNTSKGYFDKFSFQSYVVPENTNYLIFELESVGSDLLIDAVSLEPFERRGITISDLIFKPVEIPTPKASKCELCYDALNLNYCTEEKSDMLGECSYMVNSVSDPYEVNNNFLGKIDNFYALEEPWKSQSLAKSLLFCELYSNKNTCEDSNNYVNKIFSSFHKTNSNLCKWNDLVGCYKDSDGNGYSDVKQGTPDLRKAPRNIYESFSNYNYEFNNSSQTLSDFASSCDILPPNSYVYFSGKNSSGENLILTSSSNEKIGDVKINIYVSDAALVSCDPFNLTSALYLDYGVGSNFDVIKYKTNIYQTSISIKDFFINQTTKETLLADGNNDISLEIKDQSGNLEKTWQYTFDFDVSGPQISLENYLVDQYGFIDSIIGSSSQAFEFKISDHSNVVSCSYDLTPLSPEIDSSYYIPSGEFNISEPKKEFTYYFDIPITNSSINLDAYQLNISCSDVFNQETTNSYNLIVDYNTQVVILDPKSFVSHTMNLGFMNSGENIWAVSSEKNLNSCSLDFSGFDFSGTNSLSLSYIPEGFEIESYSGVTFYNNISGTISFDSDGKKEGSITCIDHNGNEFTKNIIYYYDTKLPELIDFKLHGSEVNNLKSVIEKNGKFYARDKINGVIETTLSGTGSWILDNFNLRVIDENNISPFEIYPIYDLNIDNASFIATLNISNFDNFREIYSGIETQEKNLYILKYDLAFLDKAENENSAIFEFYNDISTPKLIFSGDIVNQREGKIYTQKSAPQIEVTFNTPSYREFACKIFAQKDNLVFSKNFSMTNNLNFNLEEISSLFDLEKHSGVSLRFECIDDFGWVLSSTQQLIFDNTVPILEDFFLNGGNEKYFRNYENLNYGDLEDKLVFKLTETGEELYDCQYRFIPNSNVYSCNSSWHMSTFGSSGYQGTEDLTIISGTDSSSDTSICTRTENFYTQQASTIISGENFMTSMEVQGVCTDMVGLNTQSMDFEMVIAYVQNELISLTFEYENGSVYPIVKSFSNFDEGISIALDKEGETILSHLENSQMTESGIYEYRSSTPLDINRFNSGPNTLWAIVLDSSGSILERISGTLIVDTQVPSATLLIPDENNGLVYSDNFEIIMSGFDVGGEMDKLELYLGSNLIYDSSNLDSYDNSSLETPDSSINYCILDTCEGRVIFKNSIIGETYIFKLRAYDTAGNYNETVISVLRKDGVGILLSSSQTAIVDPSKIYWVTKNGAPTINFNTTKWVDRCTIRPMVDESWIEITGNQNAFFEKSTSLDSNTFSFDLSEFSGYDLSKLSEKISSVKIECLYNNSIYNYTRSIKYIDFIPDYVLSSNKGFAITEDPYETTISVRSVGPYKYINCEYSLDGGSATEFFQKNSKSFSANLNLNSLNSGNHKLTLLCSDILGTKGPEKEYTFSINKGDALEISNFVIFDNKNDYEINSGKIYLPNSGPFSIKSSVNKQNVQCNYVISGSDGGLISGTINFFKNLFSSNKNDLSQSDNPYIFEAENIYFENQFNDLTIDCSSSTSTVSKSFEVILLDAQIEVDVERVGLN